MKKFFIISILFLFLLSSTELGQLLKLPVMLEHFKEHKTLNSQISFIDFIHMHYAGHDTNDNDEDRDQQLPFKSHNDCGSLQVQIMPPHSETLLLRLLPLSEKNFTIYKNQDLSSSYLSSIWQPPKAC